MRKNLQERIGSVAQLRKVFPDPAACFATLRDLRWNDGYTCCKEQKTYWLSETGKYVCSKCGKKMPVTRGTIFDGGANRIELWFEAIWRVTRKVHGCSASELQRHLQLPNGSRLGYATMHEWRRKITGLLVDHEALEADVILEIMSFPSRPAKNGHRQLILLAHRPHDYQHPNTNWPLIRCAALQNDRPAAVLKTVYAMIETGAIVRTHGWPGFRALKKEFRHRPEMSHLAKPGQMISGQGERIAKQLDNWLTDTFHGAISDLTPYLNEFTFCHNHCGDVAGLFAVVLGRAVAV